MKNEEVEFLKFSGLSLATREADRTHTQSSNQLYIDSLALTLLGIPLQRTSTLSCF